MRKNVNAVMFDMDGLLFNSEDIVEKAYAAMLGRRGLTMCRELRSKVTGMPPIRSFTTLADWHSLPQSWTELSDEFHNIYRTFLPEMLEKMPGVDTLLQHLDSRGTPYGIGTSNLRDVAIECLEQCDLLHRIQFVITSQDVEKGKPDPDVYLAGAEQLGVTPAEMVVLEDSPNGCRAGIAAGAMTVAVPNAHTRDFEFPEELTLRVESLDAPELLELL